MKTTLLLTSVALVAMGIAARAENRSIYHPDDFTLARKDVEIARRAAAKADQSQPMHTVAATNKCLARISKSSMRDHATNQSRSPTGSARIIGPQSPSTRNDPHKPTKNENEDC